MGTIPRQIELSVGRFGFFIASTFFIFIGAVFYQSFQEHPWNDGNVFYIERPIFWKASHAITNEKENSPNNTVSNHPFYMSDTFWNGIYMIIGAGLAGLIGIWTDWHQRRADQRIKFRIFIQSKIRDIDNVADKNFPHFYRTIKAEIRPMIDHLNLFFWRYGKWKINRAWRAFDGINENELDGQCEIDKWVAEFTKKSISKNPSIVLKRHLANFLKI